MKTILFEQILREANKARFLEPLYSVYKTVTKDCPVYSDLLNFINVHNELQFDWQSKDREKLFKDIVDTYKEYKNNGGSNKEKRHLLKIDPNQIFIQNNTGLKCSKSKSDPITDETDIVIYPELETDKFIFITPMTYEAAVFMDSFNCGGQGAKWCIGTSDSEKYWDNYVMDDGNFFIMAFNKEEFINPKFNDDHLKYMIQFTKDFAQAWLQTDHPEDCIKQGQFKKFFGYKANDFLRVTKERNIFEYMDYIDPFFLPENDESYNESGVYLESIIEENKILVDYNGLTINCSNGNFSNASLGIGNKSPDELNIKALFDWIAEHSYNKEDSVISSLRPDILTISNAKISNLIWNAPSSKNKIKNVYLEDCEVDSLYWSVHSNDIRLDFNTDDHPCELNTLYSVASSEEDTESLDFYKLELNGLDPYEEIYTHGLDD